MTADDTRRIAEQARTEAGLVAQRLEDHLAHCAERWETVQQAIREGNAGRRFLIGTGVSSLIAIVGLGIALLQALS